MTDSRAPLFFLSYARAKDHSPGLLPPGPRNPEVVTFFSDVLGLVRHVVVYRPGDRLGFMDLNVETGRPWEPALLHAVGTCRVFVALLSPPYLKGSEWCAMEWDLFSKRTVRQNVDGQARVVQGSAMLPLIWTPIPPDAPRMVTDIQWFVPSGLPADHVARYEAEGLLGLSKVYPEIYAAVVWKIAQKIDEISRSYRPDPVFRQDTEGLRRSFEEGEQ